MNSFCYLCRYKKTIMDVIYIMIVVSVILAIFFLFIFIKTVKKGQYDDMYTPSVRMLFDDELVKEKSKKINSTNTEN